MSFYRCDPMQLYAAIQGYDSCNVQLPVYYFVLVAFGKNAASSTAKHRKFPPGILLLFRVYQRQHVKN